MNLPTISRKSHKAAFTLVELLVALAITAVISGLMVSMVTYVMSSYNRTSGTLAAIGQSSAVLSQLGTDLQSAVVRNSSDVMMEVEISQNAPKPPWLDTEKPTTRLIDEDQPIADNRFGQGGTLLKFFTLAPGFNLPGDDIDSVRAVSYQVIYRRITGATEAPKEFQLYRGMISSKDTFEEGYDLLNPFYTVTTLGSPGSPTLLNPSYDLVLASGIVELGIRLLYDVDDDGELDIIFPRANPSGTNDLQADGTPIPATPSGSVMTYQARGDRTIVTATTDVIGPYPQAVEVYLRVLTPEGIRELKAIEEGQITGGPDLWWDTVLRTSEAFSQVIAIPSNPL